MLPEQIKKFVDIFSKLPAIGPRQATRLAFYLINQGRGELEEAAKALQELGSAKICADCFFVHSNDGELCNICKNPERSSDTIMILEKETQLISVEKTGKYNGRYLILGELTKGGGLGSLQKLRISSLKTKIKEAGGKIKEIIIATNPTTYGDLNALIVGKELSGLAERFSRLGRGIPTGGEIEFADEETLGEALDRRN